MTTSYVLIITAAAVAVFYGVLLFPRWFAQSVVRHAMWRLRDEVFDSMIGGDLPANSEAVRAWSKFFDGIARSPAPHMFEIMAIERIRRDSQDSSSRKPLPLPETFDLDEDQTEVLTRYIEHAQFLCFSSLLLGSWVGLVTVATFAVRRLARSLIRRGTHASFRKIMVAGVGDAIDHGGLARRVEHPMMRVAAH